MENENEQRQIAFYSHIREWTISFLLLLLLYLMSYWLVARYKRHRTREDCYSGEEDATVYRISTWLCSFALCVSLGSALLLPMSIIGNEVLVHYPNSYYVKWLNISLIRGLWNQVFLGCNLSLFLLLPFAYFFTESEGLAGSRKGVMSRVYETILLLCLLAVLATGLAGLISSFVLHQNSEAPQQWLSYLPLLYSIVSMLGVLLMSVCTPLGFSAVFTLLGAVITKPVLHGSVKEDLEQLRLEEAALQRRRKLQGGEILNGSRLSVTNSPSQSLAQLRKQKKELERSLHSSPWERNVLYPLCFLVLLSMTVLALALVAANTVSLVIYPNTVAQPSSVQDYFLGYESTSHLGVVGAMLEVMLIVYLMCASVVGVYSFPWLKWLLPTPHDTPMTKVITNCIVLLVLSSALPLLSRTLGITRFNLLGHFGSLEWLGNLHVVLVYNALFFSVTTSILSQKVTRTLLKEASRLLGARLVEFKFRTKRGPKTSPRKTTHTD